MTILTLGTSYREAPLDLREVLHFPSDELRRALGPPERGGLELPEPVCEVAILSTCNRTEVYVATQNGSDRAAQIFSDLQRAVARHRGLEPDSVDDHWYRLAGQTAREHLCRVASGLESMVLGETEILGQVNQAYSVASEMGRTGPTLEDLFTTAIRSGRRARSHTAISRKPASVSSAAVAAAVDRIGDLRQTRVLIVGRGKMGRAALRNLMNRGVAHLAVATRDTTSEPPFAGVEQFGIDTLASRLSEFDLIITSSSATRYLIDLPAVRDSAAARSGKEQILIDIAVPRNVDPRVGTVRGIQLINLDHLDRMIRAHLAERRSQVPRVEEIIRDELASASRSSRPAPVRGVTSLPRGVDG